MGKTALACLLSAVGSRALQARSGSARHLRRGAHIRMSSTEKHFDYLVIGGGSGGIASAKRAASYGKKVAVVEKARLGGTCVNVGCVPKKCMWNAAHIAEIMHDATLYSYSGTEAVTFDWGKFKTSRDNYITRLNGIYSRGLDGSGITQLVGTASFNDAGGVTIDGEAYTADHVLIAVGGKPSVPTLEGAEHCITSDGFFELEVLPKSAAVVGAGYIAVEMAGIFNALGTTTSLIVRGNRALRNFDDMVSGMLDSEMKRQGMTVVPDTALTKVVLDENTGLKIVYAGDKEVGRYETVLLAIGRDALTKPLALEHTKVATDGKGYIVVDEYQNTAQPGVHALGDVCGLIELTPMAIAAGRRLADRLFDGQTTAKADYSLVPTVVFSHPTIGVIGLTEAEARAKHGDEDIKVYQSTFVNLWYGPMPIEPSTKPKTAMKIVCLGKEEKVVGLHIIGMAADEVLQGFGVAMKMGATKADFDSCIAIHPTAAEELVTLAPWGLSGADKKGAR
ncbi:hypothetical protein M885DRAFT_528486 [Pelagophyceae sp. CCMP2097]|nr:hypothetical protein M885DRAFT_528486 [Pelagophyceae sp. CCMP2097]